MSTMRLYPFRGHILRAEKKINHQVNLLERGQGRVDSMRARDVYSDVLNNRTNENAHAVYIHVPVNITRLYYYIYGVQ